MTLIVRVPGAADLELDRVVLDVNGTLTAVAIAAIGPEGADSAALAAADIVAPSIAVALDLLCDPQAMTATLRP